MLTVLLGFHLAAHLMTAQCIKSHLEQTLVPNPYSDRVAVVIWSYQNV